MREDCKYFQTREFASGDATRFCALYLAPEAPWRCPDDCRRYTRRVGDPSFVTAVAAASPPPEPDLHPGAAAVLGSAEDIITAIGSELAAEERRRREEEARRREPAWWQRWRERGPHWRR
jgi:hypothetical protein